MKWYFWLDSCPRPGWANMAIDQGLLDLAAEQQIGVLRVYRWAPSCLSFGRNEPAARRYDRAAIAARGLDVVRRPTGGRAVWHARELTYAVSAPADALGSLPEAYRAIHQCLAAAVTRLGAPAELASPSPVLPLNAGACFARPVGGEVMVRGRKVVGSAQLRERGALLQHGSMLLEDSQEMVNALLSEPGDPGQEAPLSDLLGRTVSWSEAAAAVEAAASEWVPRWEQLPEPSRWLTAGAPHEERFQSDDWTWRR